MLPNGMFGHLYGPVEGRRNDNSLLAESGLLAALAGHAIQHNMDANQPMEECTLQMFGDPAYGVGPHLLSPFAGAGERSSEEKDWNHQMSQARIEVEHGFALVMRDWPFLTRTSKMQVYSSPVGRYYRVAVLLTNALACMHPNQISTHFNCPPPLLQEYFHGP